MLVKFKNDAQVNPANVAGVFPNPASCGGTIIATAGGGLITVEESTEEVVKALDAQEKKPAKAN